MHMYTNVACGIACRRENERGSEEGQSAGEGRSSGLGRCGASYISVSASWTVWCVWEEVWYVSTQRYNQWEVIET